MAKCKNLRTGFGLEGDGMKLKNRTILERLAGQLEGLAFGAENKKISIGLFDMAKCIDGVIQDESEGDDND